MQLPSSHHRVEGLLCPSSTATTSRLQPLPERGPQPRGPLWPLLPARGGRLLGAGGDPQHVAAAPHCPTGGEPPVRHRDRQTHRHAGLCLWPPAECVYKAHTNDTRESPAIRICRDLLEEGAVLAIVDPKVSKRQIVADLGMAPGSGEGSVRRHRKLSQMRHQN